MRVCGDCTLHGTNVADHTACTTCGSADAVALWHAAFEPAEACTSLTSFCVIHVSSIWHLQCSVTGTSYRCRCLNLHPDHWVSEPLNHGLPTQCTKLMTLVTVSLLTTGSSFLLLFPVFAGLTWPAHWLLPCITLRIWMAACSWCWCQTH